MCQWSWIYGLLIIDLIHSLNKINRVSTSEYFNIDNI